MAETYKITVREDDLELRLDQLLAKHVPELSRRKARLAIEIGGVFVESKRVKVASRKLKKGQKVTVHSGGALNRAKSSAPLDLGFEILFEDEEIVVVNKAAGLITAPTPESDRGNLKYLLENRTDTPCEISVVHRLDKDTSGILVMAKSSNSNMILSQNFKNHTIDRQYFALVSGHLETPEMIIETPVGGKSALTHIKSSRVFSDCTEIRATLETGRTHQIRLHCRSIGHGVIGDPLYGTSYRPRPPQMVLHAAFLSFEHPLSKKRLTFEKNYTSILQDWFCKLADFGTE